MDYRPALNVQEKYGGWIVFRSGRCDSGDKLDECSDDRDTVPGRGEGWLGKATRV